MKKTKIKVCGMAQYSTRRFHSHSTNVHWLSALLEIFDEDEEDFGEKGEDVKGVGNGR